MRKLFIPLVLASMLLIVVFGLLYVVRGQAASNGEIVLNSETQDGNTRQISAPSGASIDQPNIGFIDSPTTACVQPNQAKNDCYINWYYLSVNADPNYIITMTVKLNDSGYIANYQGFFQTSMYAPYAMNPQGYKVACGELGAGGNPLLGNAYGWTIRARDSGGLKSANYGTAYCPAYIP
jgi:hypothetical protein